MQLIVDVAVGKNNKRNAIIRNNFRMKERESND